MEKIYSYNSIYKNNNGKKNFISKEMISDENNYKILSNVNGKKSIKIINKPFAHKYNSLFSDNSFYTPFEQLNNIEKNLLYHPIFKKKYTNYQDILLIFIFLVIILIILLNNRKN